MDLKQIATYFIRFFSTGKLLKTEKDSISGQSEVVSGEPWFLVISVGILSCTMWLAMVLFSLWLYKKRKQHKKMPRETISSLCRFASRNSCVNFL